MSSPIAGGGDGSFVYAAQGTKPVDEADAADPTLSAKTSDSIAQSPQVTSALKQYTFDASSPQLHPYDSQAAAASDKNLQKLQDAANSSGKADLKTFFKSLPSDLQQHIADDSPDPAVQNLKGQAEVTMHTSALARIGLEALPQAQPLGTISSIPGPGPIDPTASPAEKNAQLISNGIESTQNALKIGTAQWAANGGDDDSVLAFLKAIGEAIAKLKEFLGTIQQAMNKGKWGQDISSLADWNWMAAKQQKEMEDKKSSGGGLLGGIVNALGLGEVVNAIAGIFDGIPFISTLFRGIFGGGSATGGGFGDLLSMNIPIISDILEMCAKLTKGIPFVGEICQMMADKPLLAVLALGAAIAVCLPLVLLAGPGLLLLAPVIFGLILLAGGMVSGSGKDGKDDNMLKDLLGGDIPIVGGMLKGLLGMLSGIPILGDLAKLAGDNQMLFLIAAIAFVVVVCCTMFLGPFALLLAAVVALAIFGGGMALEGDGNKLPIIGDLFPSGGKKEEEHPSRAHGRMAADSRMAGTTVGRLAKDHTQVDEGTAQLIALVTQLIALLTRVQAAARGGAVGVVSAVALPTEEILGILNQVNAGGGLGSKPGDIGAFGQACKAAQQAGKNGDYQAMIDALLAGLRKLGADPAKLGAATNYVRDDLTVSSSNPQELPSITMQQAA